MPPSPPSHSSQKPCTNDQATSSISRAGVGITDHGGTGHQLAPPRRSGRQQLRMVAVEQLGPQHHLELGAVVVGVAEVGDAHAEQVARRGGKGRGQQRLPEVAVVGAVRDHLAS